MYVLYVQCSVYDLFVENQNNGHYSSQILHLYGWCLLRSVLTPQRSAGNEYSIYLKSVILQLKWKHDLMQMLDSRRLCGTFLFSNGFCFSIAAGLYGAGLAGYVGFQQNRNIQGELVQATVFVLLKGTTAPTGFLGWRDERKGGCGAFSLNSFSSYSFSLSLPGCVSFGLSLKCEWRTPALSARNILQPREVSYHGLSSGLLTRGPA